MILSMGEREIKRHRKKGREEEQTEGNIGFTATEDKWALKRTYRNFVIPGVAKVNIDGYFD